MHCSLVNLHPTLLHLLLLMGDSRIFLLKVTGAGDDGGVGSSSWDGWSLYVLEWLGLSMVIGSLRIRVRHVHASLMVELARA